jgi:hypothetical protein
MIRFISCAIAFSAASLILASCGGSSSQNVTPSLAPAVRGATNGDLLYVGHAVRIGSGFRGELSVFTFPGGKSVSTIDLSGLATGVCSDSSGNVWVVVLTNHTYNAYEFAHGGTTPVTTIHIPHPHDFAQDCAVDPTTGDLAVLTGGLGSPPSGNADVWAGARPGKPEVFSIPFSPTSCTYDGNGNLFADGWIGSTVLFNLAELSKGSRSFARVALDKTPGSYPGGVRWDGQYVDVADNNFSGYGKLYRVEISTYKGHVASIVRPNKMSYMAVFDVLGSELVGTSGNEGKTVGFWNYPAGGKRLMMLARFPYPVRGLAISVKE